MRAESPERDQHALDLGVRARLHRKTGSHVCAPRLRRTAPTAGETQRADCIRPRIMVRPAPGVRPGSVGPTVRPSLIIIVDDDRPVRESLADLFAAAGYETAAFASAEEFLRSPQAQTFDCLVSDVQLTGMSGLALLATLKAQSPSKPVILITARLDADWPEQALQAGASCFLHKPFAAQALLECVEASLSDSAR